MLILLLSFTACGNQPLKEIETLETSTTTVTNTEEVATKLSEDLEVHFIDVGQGDATLIINNDETLLIDAGNNSKGTVVQNYIRKQGITELDYVIGTHADADH